MSIWIEIVLVTVILAGMIMLLLSINHLFTGRFNDDKQSADLLRDDIEKKDDVITDNSIFKGLVTPEHKAHGKL